jgi:hypothetical protein
MLVSHGPPQSGTITHYPITPLPISPFRIATHPITRFRFFLDVLEHPPVGSNVRHNQKRSLAAIAMRPNSRPIGCVPPIEKRS